MTGNMIGRIFNNRYKITDRIGIGGMAEVYRAQDSVLGRVVAVKTMLPQYAADPSFTQRFKQEAASAANLQSPYIVNVYDWGQDEGTYYIVMEYVRGSDLKTAIIERGAINQRKVAEIGSQVCQALSAAHNLDIIHRDIKPQNIMVQPDGNVKVMDFGIARAKNSVKTQTSSVLGTAHYISPEQAQGKELTPASDIYSLGIVLYEAATGKLPFDGPDAISVAMKQVNDDPALPSEINPDIDPDLEMIIMKALAKRPIERFATANDMRLSLNDYLAGRPVNLGDTFSGAETAIMGGMAGAAGAGAASTSVMPAMQNGANPSNAATSYRTNDGKNKKSNKKTVAIVLGVLAALLVIGGIAWAVLSMSAEGGVPDITNKTVEVATQQLEDAGYVMGKQDTAFSNDVDAGKIISQDPPAGTKADEGSTVNVVVSSGKQAIKVPDLTNMTADEARQELEKLGLKASPGKAEESSTIELNRVIRQDPAAGTEVREGDTIIYFLSLGVGNASVPNVVGSSESEAKSTLENAGFQVSVQTGGFSSEYAQGQVMRQDPGAGISVEKGTAINIFISQGPEPEPEPEPDPSIPDVKGQLRSEAINSLKNAGFQVKEETAYSSTVESDRVISQDRSGTAPKGSTVVIVISKGPDPANTQDE